MYNSPKNMNDRFFLDIATLTILLARTQWTTPVRYTGSRHQLGRSDIGDSMRKRRSKSINPRAYKPWQKLSDFKDTGQNMYKNLKLIDKMNLLLNI